MFKNARQVEFAELAERMREKGIKPAGIARLLKISKASVSKILDGVQSPRDSTLELFRHIVAEHFRTTGELVYPMKQEALVLRDDYAIKLRNLPEEHQRTVERIIDQLEGVSSTVASIAAKSQSSALALAQQRDPKSRPSAPTGEPTVYRPAKARGSAKRPKHPPAPPAPAPT